MSAPVCIRACVCVKGKREREREKGRERKGERKLERGEFRGLSIRFQFGEFIAEVRSVLVR